MGCFVNDGEVYGLIPYFVCRDALGDIIIPIKFPICITCKSALLKGKISPYMVFSENYGCPQKVLGMEVFKINDIGRNMMYGVRRYNTILELKVSGAAVPVLKSSVIHFLSDRIVLPPDESDVYLPVADADQNIQIQFLGSHGRKDVINRLLSSHPDSPIRVSCAFHMQVLRCSKDLNPLLQNNLIRNDEEGVIVQNNTISKIMRCIVYNRDNREAVVSESVSSNIALIDPEFGGNDHTAIRSMVDNPSGPDAEFLAATTEFVESMSLNANESKYYSVLDVFFFVLFSIIFDYTLVIMRCYSGEIEENNAPEVAENIPAIPQQIYNLSRDSVPISEFDIFGVQTILLKGFANLFFLGEGLVNIKGDIPVRMILHLLRYFDGRFNSNAELIFLLADMKYRHEVSRNGKAKLIPSKSTYEMIKSNFFTGTNVLDRLKAAQLHPNSPDSKAFVSTLKRVIKVQTASIEWTSTSRASVLQVCYAIIARFGTPNVFQTVSPDDSYNLDNIRRSIIDRKVTGDPNDFFDHEVENILECLKNGGENKIFPLQLIASNGKFFFFFILRGLLYK